MLPLAGLDPHAGSSVFLWAEEGEHQEIRSSYHRIPGICKYHEKGKLAEKPGGPGGGSTISNKCLRKPYPGQ